MNHQKSSGFVILIIILWVFPCLLFGGTDQPPFGSFDTPISGSTVNSSIAVTGWALDDVEVQAVKLFRGTASNLVYIGDASFVEGARPDVEAAYPTYPNNSRAGWGYMLLTNFLPNSGNGSFTLHAIAMDGVGNEVTLGTKTITCDNANAVKPFGAIDTPTQGGTASGSGFVNWGWVLTPQPNSIPVNGSTINVYVDGVNIGHPNYHIYRSDIAILFPGYANSLGAVGYFYLDTTAYSNGVHTIQWTATDTGNNSDGIGSRYFSIQNTQEDQQPAMINNHKTMALKRFANSGVQFQPVQVRKGYDQLAEAETVYPDGNGITAVEIKEMERVVINLQSSGWSGFQVVGTQYRKLPIGSTLLPEEGQFLWQPGAAFLGVHQLVFVNLSQTGQRVVRININIK